MQRGARRRSTRRLSVAEEWSSLRSRLASDHGWIALVFLTALVLLPLARGGDPTWSGVLTACIVGGLLVVSAITTPSGPTLGVATRLALFVGAATMLHAIPAPLALVEGFLPRAARDLAESRRLLGLELPAAWPLTFSPAATRHAALDASVLVGVTWLAERLVSFGRRGALVYGVAVAGVIMGVVTAFHTIVDARTLFGLYTPTFAPMPMSPLLNVNHLSAFAAFTFPFALHVASQRDGQLAIGWRITAAGLFVLSVLCFSRGGWLGLAVTTLVFAASRSAQKVGPWTWAVVGVGAVLASLAAFDRMWAELALLAERPTEGLSKVRIAIEGLALVREQPWIGIGRGAFSEAFVALEGTRDRFENPENILVQYGAELGVPVAVFCFVIGGAALARAAWAARRRGGAGHAACAALAGLAVHELVDFSTERLGVACLAAVAFVIAVTRDDNKERHRASPAASPSSRGWAWTGSRSATGAAGVFVVAVGVGMAPPAHTLSVDAIGARVQAAIEHEEWDEARALARAGYELHPSEPAMPLFLAFIELRRAVARGEDLGAVVPFLNRAMRAAPGWPSPHLVAAEWLWRLGATRQAWGELRETGRRHPTMYIDLGCAWLATPAASEAARAFVPVPDAPEGDARMLNRLASCPVVDPAAQEVIDAALAPYRFVEVRVRAAERARAAGRLAEVEQLLANDHDDPAARRVVAHARFDAGDHRAVAGLLAGRSGLREEDLVLLARAYAALGDEEALSDAYAQLRALADGAPAAVARAYLVQGDVELERGHRPAARRAYELAHRAQPDGIALRRAAETVLADGDRARALVMYRELCRILGEPDGVECRRADQIERDLAP